MTQQHLWNHSLVVYRSHNLPVQGCRIANVFSSICNPYRKIITAPLHTVPMESPPTINAQRDFFRTKKKLNSPISSQRSPIHTAHKREIQTDTLGVLPTFKKRENQNSKRFRENKQRQSSPISRKKSGKSHPKSNKNGPPGHL